MRVVRDGVMEGDTPTFNVAYIHTLVRYQKSCTLEFYDAAGKKKKKFLCAGDKDGFVISFWEF